MFGSPIEIVVVSGIAESSLVNIPDFVEQKEGTQQQVWVLIV
jgi:hypothetical protein